MSATGICARSASVCTCSIAPDSETPCPARITGRLALRISSAACLSPLSSTRSIGMWAIGPRLGSFKVEDGRALLRILGNVDEHRPRPTALRNLERVADRMRDVLSLVHKEVVLWLQAA